MEKDSRFGFHQHPLSRSMNLFGFPSDTSHLNTRPVFTNPPIEDAILRTVPAIPISGLQQSNLTPQFCQAFPPVMNSTCGQNFLTALYDFGQQRSPTIEPPPPQKRFLVFDQSGNKTTLIYSSAFHTPVQFGARWVAPNIPTLYNNLSQKEARDSVYPLRSNMNDEYLEENSGDDTRDEMHEDTEELNALLSSDDDFSEDDEETSTGHSPSTMTDNGVQDLAEEMGEEVDSFSGPTKRRKLSNGGYDAVMKMKGPNGVSSSKTFASSGLEDDAESSCGNGCKQNKGEMDCSWTGGQRSRREKIRETVSILQRIVPGVNGKDDAVVVIDEAIRYLRFLKVKAKASGLDDAL